MWKVGAKQFKHLATFAKLFEVVEGFGGAEQCLLCGLGLKLGKPVSERAASNCLVLRKASDLLRLMISIRFAVAGWPTEKEEKAHKGG